MKTGIKPCLCRAVSALITAQKRQCNNNHLFSRCRHSHHRRVENALSYGQTWFCGNELNVGLETHPKCSFWRCYGVLVDVPTLLVQHRKFLNCVNKTERRMQHFKWSTVFCWGRAVVTFSLKKKRWSPCFLAKKHIRSERFEIITAIVSQTSTSDITLTKDFC